MLAGFLLLCGPEWSHLEGGASHSSTMCVCVRRVYHPASGRVLEVSTSQPGLQFYTANHLDGSLLGKGGSAHGRHSSFCLETQAWPDAVNQVSPRPSAAWSPLSLQQCVCMCVQATFPSCLLRAGDLYHHVTRFSFTTA